MLHRRGPSGPQPVISVTTNKTIRCVWIDVVRRATRESNTARVVSNVYRVPFPFSLSLSPTSLSISLLFLFSVSFFLTLYSSVRYVSVHLATLSRAPPYSSIYTGRFCPPSFSSSSSLSSFFHPFLRRVFLSPSLHLSYLPSPVLQVYLTSIMR